VILEGVMPRKRSRRRARELGPTRDSRSGCTPSAHQFAGDPQRAIAIVREPIAATPSARAVGEIRSDYQLRLLGRATCSSRCPRPGPAGAGTAAPIVVHTREADEDTLAILREEGMAGGCRSAACLHCFTGNDALAAAGLDLGLYISLAGILTFPRAGESP